MLPLDPQKIIAMIEERWGKAGKWIAGIVLIVAVVVFVFWGVHETLNQGTGIYSTVAGWFSKVSPSPPQMWQLTAKQKDDIKSAFAAAPTKAPILITVVPGAPSDAIDTAYEFMYALDKAGWAASVFPQGDAEFSPHYTGIILAFTLDTNLEKDDLVRTFKEIFKKANLEPTMILRSPNAPKGGLELVIGRNP